MLYGAWERWRPMRSLPRWKRKRWSSRRERLLGPKYFRAFSRPFRHVRYAQAPKRSEIFTNGCAWRQTSVILQYFSNTIVWSHPRTLPRTDSRVQSLLGGTRLGHSQSWCRYRYCGDPSHEVRGSDECRGVEIEFWGWHEDWHPHNFF